MLKKVLSVLCLVPAVATAQSYIVYDFTHDRVLESSSPNHVQPIASVTKLMTANVFLEIIETQTVLHRLLTMISITLKALIQNYLNIRRFLVMNC